MIDFWWHYKLIEPRHCLKNVTSQGLISMNLIPSSCKIKGFWAYADVWTPVVYFYGINRIEISMALIYLQLY